MQIKKQNFYYHLSLAIILIVGIFRRFLPLSWRSLEYDEIWTFQNYTQLGIFDIFSDLATPNNHPLNSLLIKYSLKIFSENLFTAIRFPAFFFGVATLLLGTFSAAKFFKSRSAVAAAAIFFAVNPMLIHYSNTGRGYAIQSFAVLSMAICLYLFHLGKSPKIYAGLILASALLCCLSIYSGLMFTGALFLTYIQCFFDWKNFKAEIFRNKYLIAAGILFTIFVLFWYGGNYDKIQAAQKFGMNINSFALFFSEWSKILFELKIIMPIIFLMAGLIYYPKDRVLQSSLIFLIIILISPFFTKLGPARVYTPIIGVLSISGIYAAVKLAEKVKFKFAQICFLAILTVPILLLSHPALKKITPPDWAEFCANLEKNTPKDYYIIYPAGDTYPISFNAPETVIQHALRSNENLTGLLAVNMPQQISGVAGSQTVRVNIPQSPTQKSYNNGNNHFDLYHLELLNHNSAPNSGRPLLLIVDFCPEIIFKNLFREIKGDLILLNAFFNRNYPDKYNRNSIQCAFFLPQALQNKSDYLEITRKSGGKFKFYLLKP